jgi:hypothetical protein
MNNPIVGGDYGQAVNAFAPLEDYSIVDSALGTADSATMATDFTGETGASALSSGAESIGLIESLGIGGALATGNVLGSFGGMAFGPLGILGGTVLNDLLGVDEGYDINYLLGLDEEEFNNLNIGTSRESIAAIGYGGSGGGGG